MDMLLAELVSHPNHVFTKWHFLSIPRVNRVLKVEIHDVT